MSQTNKQTQQNEQLNRMKKKKPAAKSNQNVSLSAYQYFQSSFGIFLYILSKWTRGQLYNLARHITANGQGDSKIAK